MNPLQNLLHRDLASVEFVRDYIQLRFDGPVLTVISHPTMVIDGKSISRDDPAFCNQILACIGKIVNDASLVEGQLLKISFENGFTFFVSLKPENYRTAEAVIFDDKPNGVWIW